MFAQKALSFQEMLRISHLNKVNKYIILLPFFILSKSRDLAVQSERGISEIQPIEIHNKEKDRCRVEVFT